MALGARAGDVLRLVLRQGLGLTAVGIALGLLAAAALSRTLGTLLFGVSPTDAIAFGGIALLLAGVALLACALPARRAAQVDPLVALREE
jgi:ABC-type antimicrobial peptide transport system permease subunit